MIIPHKEIVDFTERKRLHYARYLLLPDLCTAPLCSDEFQDQQKQYGWMNDCSVHMDDKPAAQALAVELYQALASSSNHPDIPALLERIKAYRLKDPSEYTAEDIWRENAFTLATYSGPPGVISRIVRRLTRYTGNVLEVMCGHTTYFARRKHRTVTVVDGCEESLKRYPYPVRRRIVCDLDNLAGGGNLPFDSCAFDAVSICFGFKYPKHFDQLLQAFRTILKPGGKLSFIENPDSEYSHLTHRKFDPDSATEPLVANGFTAVQVERLPIPVKVWDAGLKNNFYHLEGTNP